MLKLRPILQILVLLAGLVLLGCRKPVEPVIADAGAKTDGVSALDILAGVQKAYAQAPVYSDEGYLYLSYRLMGSLIQEQQPWKTKFQRPNFLAGDWFNSRIRCDGSRLGCFVFDNDTANLDSQWLVLDAAGKIPLSQLLDDPMARHFVAGDSEIPLDTTVPGGQMPLIPVVAGLLTGELEWPVLKKPEVAVRMDDALVDDRPCYHLQLSSGQVSVECWIDMENFLVRQMTLPVELLDPNVRSSPEIGELRFFARMHKCGFSTGGSAESLAAFEVTAPGGAKPVRHLIALPEVFPCELVGMPMPALGFQAADGSRVIRVPVANRTQVLIWLPGIIDAATEAGVAAMVAETGEADVRYVLNEEHLQPVPGNRMMYPAVARCLAPLPDRDRILVDPGLENLQKARMKQSAGAIVIDGDMVVQYALGLNDEQWPQKLLAAISRIQAGDNIGREMQADYAQYLETYHRRLQMVAVNDAAGSSSESGETAGPLPLMARQIWSCDQVQKPGNLAVAGSGSIVAIDGWRSIVELDLNGSVTGTRNLDIPAGSSISRIRQTTHNGKLVRAVFSVMGQGVFLLDHDWNLAATVSGDSREMDRVLDCQFGVSGNGEPALTVSFETSGVRQFRMDGTAESNLSGQRFELIGFAGTSLLGLQNGRVMPVVGESPAGMAGNQIVTSFLAIPDAGSGSTQQDDVVAVSVGMNASQIWNATLLYDGSRAGLEGLAGPQLFDTQIEPLVRMAPRGLVCSADSNGMVRVFDSRMKTVCQFRVPGITGLAITGSGDSIIILCSSAGRVVAWRLEDNVAGLSGETSE